MKKMSEKEMMNLLNKAKKAGYEAASEVTPVPMVVNGHYIVTDGVCGFAWVIVRPGTSRFARFLRKIGLGKTNHYYGGTVIWVHDFNQSYEKKMAYAEAFAKVLRNAGIDAYASGRLD